MISNLFVYGMLRRGQPLHPELTRVGAGFLGPASMRGTLFDLGRYTGAVPSGDQLIPGELYRLPQPLHALKHLDQVEGGRFKRRLLEVEMEGFARRAWVYVLRNPP